MATSDTRPPAMPGTFGLGRVLGIAVGLHYSWFIIAALIAFSLVAQFRVTHPDWPSGQTWGVAMVTALLFFATLLAHELAHSLVARARGLPVRSITLFALGGVATIDKDAADARTEFLVAIVGPAVSFTIGFACIAAAQSLGWSLEGGEAGVAGSVLGWLGSINVVLGAFNLIPGYPLDGGRVLRALLWGVYKDGARATRTAARVGQFVAGIFIAWGLFQFFGGYGLGGLWLAFIGWFLLTAAQASYAEAEIGEALRGVRVADVMANDCVTVDPAMPVQDLVEHVLLRSGRRCIVVKQEARVLGLVTPHEIRGVDRAHWHDTSVGDVMRPLDQLKTVAPTAPVSDALREMALGDVNQLPVVADGRLEGIVSRGQILQLLHARAELKAA